MIKDFTATLQQVDHLTTHVKRFIFQLPEGEELQFEAGQYVMLKIDNNFRQYSIASPSSQKNSFEIVMEMVEGGLASQFLEKMQVGESANFKGPAGVFVLRNTPKEKVFLATGTGIAPIKSMIKTHLQENREAKLYLFFGVKTREDVYLADEFEQIHTEYPEKFFHKVCLSREESMEGLSECFAHGRVNISLEQLWENHEGHVDDFEYYVCGSKKAVDSLKAYLSEHGVQDANIFFERFTL